MLSKILVFVKENLSTILVVAICSLCVLLSFAGGYIMATYQARAPLTITQ